MDISNEASTRYQADSMAINMITYAATIGYVNWPSAIDALRAGHMMAKPQVKDILLGPPEVH